MKNPEFKFYFMAEMIQLNKNVETRDQPIIISLLLENLPAKTQNNQ